MTEYYGEVSVYGAAVSTKNKYFDGSFVSGGGSCRSNDLEIARNLSDGLTQTVDHAVGYAYDLCRKK